MENLTPELLKSLYSEKGRTESEIAEQFGIGQVQVGRLRKKWGIPTMSKGERASLTLPTLTSQQQELLIGSLLGDGWMTATSALSARFSEGHCMAQREYTEWKGNLLKPFLSNFHQGSKRDNGKVFYSWVLATVSCTILRPYYDLFYPAPDYKRVFPKDLSSLMTPFVLAVWYMDDGNRTSRGEPRIAFGLDDLSRDRAMRALRKLGLKPVIYGKGSNQAFYFPKQAMKFKALVEPYIIPCMAYKIPTETYRQAGDRNARGLSPEKAATLYGSGMSTRQIAQLYKVGQGTVTRRLKSVGVIKRRSGPTVQTYTTEESYLLLQEFQPKQWSLLSETEQVSWVRDIMDILRNGPFPKEPVKDTAQEALQKIQESRLHLEDGIIRPLSRAATTFCASFFPNRYRASSGKRLSAYEAWYDDKQLEWAIRFQLGVGDPVVPHRVLRALTFRWRTPTVFRPSIGFFMCQRYMPDGGTWWDPCAGYGGRLMGAVAAGVRYVGTDVDADTILGNQELAAVLQAHIPPVVVLCPAEEYQAPVCEMVFTSPPYFNRERYSQKDTQSWMRYGGFEDWVDGFMRPVIRQARVALSVSHGVLALNVSDITEGRTTYPLVERVQQVATEEGFVLEEILRMPLAAIKRKNPEEPILVFRPA